MLIRLPVLKGTKKLSPYEQLYRLCVKRIGHPIASPSETIVNKKTGDILKQNEFNWQWKHYDKRFMGKGYFLRKVFAWHWLNYSPRENDLIPYGHADISTQKRVQGVR